MRPCAGVMEGSWEISRPSQGSPFHDRPPTVACAPGMCSESSASLVTRTPPTHSPSTGQRQRSRRPDTTLNAVFVSHKPPLPSDFGEALTISSILPQTICAAKSVGLIDAAISNACRRFCHPRTPVVSNYLGLYLHSS
jgi:hypothetical protein